MSETDTPQNSTNSAVVNENNGWFPVTCMKSYPDFVCDEFDYRV